MIARIKNNKSPMIFEDGKQVRDFIYVKDVAKANYLALERMDKRGIYNIGTGMPTSIYDVSNNIINMLDVDINPVITNTFRIGDTRHDYANIDKVNKELKFKPEYSITDGLKKLIEWSETKNAKDLFEKAESERKIL